MSKKSLASAISAIDRNGILLVFPMDNRKEPASIWSALYPRSEMRWEWDESGDNRVADLWHMRTELSTSRKVVYTKWFRGRATFFSRDVFTAMLALLGSTRLPRSALSRDALMVLEILRSDSPLSTKELKRMADLKGKAQEASYNRAMKELWSRMLVVGFGEVDDGAFPSLAMGSTEILYEDLWAEARDMDSAAAYEILRKKLSPQSLFALHFQKLSRLLRENALPRIPKSFDSPELGG